MRTLPPALAPYLRSGVVIQILAHFLLDVDRESSLADLVRDVGAPQSVVHKEVSRLVVAGVLSDRRVGRTRLIRADPQYRLLRPLTQIIEAVAGPVPVMEAELAGIPGIELAAVFGSWAARQEGLPGAAPRDLDVLVVGSAPRAELNEAAARAEARIGLPVNITKVTQDAWRVGREPFVKTVKSRPFIPLTLSGFSELLRARK